MNKEICIRFHNLINSKDEEGAIKLMKECGDSFDVNYEYNKRIPIFSSINNKMLNLFEEIINHPTFNINIEDGFGESLLESLIHLRGAYGTEFPHNQEEEEIIDRMLKSVLRSERYDVNLVDINNNTAINIACEYLNTLWVVEELSQKKGINPNIVNDLGYTALTNAIYFKNTEAIKILSAMKNVIVRDIDLEEANKVGIDLADYGFEAAIKLKKAHEYAMA